MTETRSAPVTFDFRGQRVLVTGASRGIGFGVAEAFCAAGADVIVLADGSDIHQVAETLQTESEGEVVGLQCDITDQDAVAEAMGQLSSLDVLVNNAGLELITPVSSTDATTIDNFRRIIDINVLGTYHVTRNAIAKLQRGASIVQTCSIWSHSAVADFAAYCSSKHANLGFIRSLAAELAPRGIRVNGVCPGWVRTEASIRSLAAMSARTDTSEDVLLQEILDSQLLPGLMEPADVGPSYLFLASTAAANITGQTITVDRGSKSA